MDSDESCDLGYEASPSTNLNDHLAAETPGSSTLSGTSFGYFQTYSETSAFSDTIDEHNSCYSEPSPAHWSANKSGTPRQAYLTRLLGMKEHRNSVYNKLDDLEALEAELEMMKERLSKLLLGEDMSGSGYGVCTAVTISNSITNLYATVFGQNLRLEPLRQEKKAMWKREMDCLLSVCDYIVELIPMSHNLRDGTTIEVMESKPRLDIYINLPALKKLDTMLLEILDSFQDKEFWYAEQGSSPSNSPRSSSSQNVVLQRKEEKWWVPVPCVPPGGLSKKSRKHLQHKRDCCNQIHKAAMAINSSILAELEIPDTYIASLPKSGKASVGDTIYHFICAAETFSPGHLLDCLNIASEHEALELADRVEASMYIWRHKACLSHSKSSWRMVKDLVSDIDRSDKNHVLAEKAESLLFCLKQKYPGLSQTTLDTCKIQYNRDVGQAVLESYSRVLEGLAFNMVAWINDVLYVDTTVKSQE